MYLRYFLLHKKCFLYINLIRFTLKRCLNKYALLLFNELIHGQVLLPYAMDSLSFCIMIKLLKTDI